MLFKTKERIRGNWVLPSNYLPEVATKNKPLKIT